MNTIRILEDDGCTRTFNPIYVKEVRLIHPDETSLDWVVILNFNDGGTVSRSFSSKDKAEIFFKYADGCIKSIGNL